MGCGKSEDNSASPIVDSAVIVTGNRYRSTIQNFLWSELDDIDVQPYVVSTANETFDLLRHEDETLTGCLGLVI